MKIKTTHRTKQYRTTMGAFFLQKEEFDKSLSGEKLSYLSPTSSTHELSVVKHEEHFISNTPHRFLHAIRVLPLLFFQWLCLLLRYAYQICFYDTVYDVQKSSAPAIRLSSYSRHQIAQNYCTQYRVSSFIDKFLYIYKEGV